MWPRCVPTVLTDTNSACPISRLVSPPAASSATRRSDGVSASRPEDRSRRRWTQVAASSSSIRARRGSAPHCCARRIASRSGSRAALRLPARRFAVPSSIERARELEPSRRAPEPFDRLAQHRDPVVAACEQPGDAQRDADAARLPEPERSLELCVGERTCPIGICGGERKREHGAPREVVRVVDGSPASPARAQVRDRVERVRPCAIRTRPRVIKACGPAVVSIAASIGDCASRASASAVAPRSRSASARNVADQTRAKTTRCRSPSSSAARASASAWASSPGGGPAAPATSGR